MADGQIVFEIKGDNKGLKDTLSQTTRDIQNESQKWDKSVDDSSGKISDSLIGAFQAVVASTAFIKIGQMLIQLGGESIQLASDLEEVQNVVDVTFGKEGAAKMESWAKNAGQQFGLTELQAKKYASTIGAMLKSSGMAGDDIYDMSTALAGLAADMASFYNLDFETSFAKIRAGLAGEIEPLRQLGINMSVANMEAFAMANGMETSFDKLSQGEQTLLRYKYLMNATADAQGDFVRTADSYANSQRRMATGIDTLKAQLGEALLPIATTVSNAVNDLLDLLIYQPPETAFDVAEESMKNAATQATQAQGIIGYMEKLQEQYGAEASATEEWAIALEKLKDVFPDVSQFIDAQTGALTASNAELKAYIENSKQAAIEDAKRAALGSLSSQYVEAGQAYYTAEINRDMAQAQANEAWNAIVNYVRGHQGQEDFTGEGLSIDQLKYAAQSVANEFGESQETINAWIKIYNDQTSAANGFSNEMENLQLKMNSLEADLDIATAALSRMSAAASSAASSLGGSDPTANMNSGQYYNWYYSTHSHARGLDYVPYDGYIGILHRGERIQTAAEAALYRQANLQQPSVDYGRIGSAMWANAPQMGGNVYLDGRVVGQVVSDQQGRSYRQLTRSGWQG